MLTYEEMRERLRQTLSEHRFLHSMGVMETALHLAQVHGADEEVCRTAALLHDCAKCMSEKEMLDIIARYGISLYPGEENYPYLLHAPAGAALAQRDYGISDPAVLSAIRCHTVGSKHMSLTDMIIFVADFIEPNREDFPGLDDVRLQADCDIFAAGEECKHLTQKYCLARGQKIFTI